MSNWRKKVKPTAGVSGRSVQVVATPETKYSQLPQNEFPDFMSNPEGVGARAVVKNFGSSNPEDNLMYLRGVFPDAEFDYQDGEYLAREKGQRWSRLDPSMLSLGEMGRDFLDVGYDVASGFGEGAAAAAGFAAGGPLGAAGANAAASGGSEFIRQGVGNMFGIPMDPTDIAIATGTGAVAPKMFGMDKVAKNRLSKETLTSIARRFGLNSVDEVTQAHVDKATQSVMGKAAEYTKQRIFPGLGEFASGIDAHKLRGYANNQDHIDEMVNNQIFANSDISGRHDRYLDFLGDRKREATRQITDGIRGADGIDAKRVIDTIDSEIARIENGAWSDESMRELAQLKAWRDDVLRKTYPDETRQVHMKVRKETPRPDKVVETEVEYQMFPTTGTKLAQGRAPIYEQPPVRRDSLGMTYSPMDQTTTRPIPVLSKGEGDIPMASREWRDGQNTHRYHQGVNPDKAQFNKEIIPGEDLTRPTGFVNTEVPYEVEIPGEKRVAKGRRIEKQEPLVEYVPTVVTEKYNPGVEGRINPITKKHEILPTMTPDVINGDRALELHRSLSNAATWDSMYPNAVGSIQPIARKAHGALRQSFDEVNPSIQQGKDAFKDLLAIEELLGTMAKVDAKGNPLPAGREAFEREMARTPGKGKTTREAGLMTMENLGYDPKDDRAIIGGYSFAKDPSWLPISTKGATSTSRNLALMTGAGLLGGALDFNPSADFGMDNGGAGAGKGAIIAGVLASPLALKSVIRGNNLVNKVGKKVIDKTRTRRLLTPLVKDEVDTYLMRESDGWNGL